MYSDFSATEAYRHKESTCFGIWRHHNWQT